MRNARRGVRRIWLPPCDDSTKTVRVNAASGSVPGAVDSTGMVAFGSNTVWGDAANGDRAGATNDPRASRSWGRPARTPTTAMPSPASTAWGISCPGAHVDPIDPKTHEVQAASGSRDSLPTTACIKPYSTTRSDEGLRVRTVRRVRSGDPAVHQDEHPRILDTHRCYLDQAPVAALGSLWLRISDTSVVRVNPTDGTVIATYPAGPGGGAVAVDFGSLWVANFEHRHDLAGTHQPLGGSIGRLTVPVRCHSWR